MLSRPAIMLPVRTICINIQLSVKVTTDIGKCSVNILQRNKPISDYLQHCATYLMWAIEQSVSSVQQSAYICNTQYISTRKCEGNEDPAERKCRYRLCLQETGSPWLIFSTMPKIHTQNAYKFYIHNQYTVCTVQ